MREPLVALLIGSLSALLFLILFDWVALRLFPAATAHADLLVRSAVHGFANPPLTLTARGLTWLGSVPVLAGIMLLAALFLKSRVPRYHAFLPLIALACAELTGELVRWVVRRPRPHPWFGLTAPHSPSFPSGHAFDSTVGYLVLAAVAIPFIRSREGRIACAVLAACLPLAIGFTRVYLGVHWPSDVLAGWIAGLCLTVGVRRSLQASAPHTAAVHESVPKN